MEQVYIHKVTGELYVTYYNNDYIYQRAYELGLPISKVQPDVIIVGSDAADFEGQDIYEINFNLEYLGPL